MKFNCLLPLPLVWLTDMQDVGWIVQQTQIPAVVPGLPCRNQRILGCSSPTSWSPPWRLWVSHRTVWCHLHPLSGLDWLLSHHTEITDSKEVLNVSGQSNYYQQTGRKGDFVLFLPWNNPFSQRWGSNQYGPSQVKRSCSQETLCLSHPGQL